MERIDKILGVDEILAWLPSSSRDRPPFPMDKVLELTTADAGVQDLFDFIFFLVVDDDGRRRLLDTTRDVVGTHAHEKRDMEHRVDTHGRRELEAVGGLADLLHYWKRAEAPVVELVARAGGLDVAAEQPHLFAVLEVGGLLPLLVVEPGLRGRGVGDVERELGMDVAKPLDHIVGSRVVGLGGAGGDGGDGVGVVTAAGKERGLAGRGVDSVVVGELGER